MRKYIWLQIQKWSGNKFLLLWISEIWQNMQPSERKCIVLCIPSFNSYPYSKQNQSLYCLQEVVWRSVLSLSVVCHVILLNSMRLCYSYIQTFAYKYKNPVLIWNAYLLSILVSCNLTVLSLKRGWVLKVLTIIRLIKRSVLITCQP